MVEVGVGPIPTDLDVQRGDDLMCLGGYDYGDVTCVVVFWSSVTPMGGCLLNSLF